MFKRLGIRIFFTPRVLKIKLKNCKLSTVKTNRPGEESFTDMK